MSWNMQVITVPLLFCVCVCLFLGLDRVALVVFPIWLCTTWLTPSPMWALLWYWYAKLAFSSQTKWHTH